MALTSTAELRSLADSLAGMEPAETEEDALARVAVLEALKAICAAVQVRETDRLDELRSAAETERGVPLERRCRGLAAEVGLARKASGWKGSQYLGFARALAREMPHTYDALNSGVITEWRATILARETGYLTREAREEVDRRLCADPSELVGIGDRALAAAARREAYRLEPQKVVDRAAKVAKDRRVTSRPAPDCMSRISALLPVAQGVAVYAALKRHADSVVGADDRTHAQIMADTLVERVTGQASADAVPVAVEVVISDRSLLGDDDSAAEVPDYGPIPRWLAHRLIDTALDPDHEVGASLRRLYARPADGTLVTMEAKSRSFPKGLARFIKRRDQFCRVPYCDAPVAEIDHAQPHRHGGPTTAENADGSCVAHNRAKEAGGWTYRPLDGRPVLAITTPTGVMHIAPPPPAAGFTPESISELETKYHALLNAA